MEDEAARVLPEEEPVELGVRYRDAVTGFEGTATIRTVYLVGNAQVYLENKERERWFDEARLVRVVEEPVEAAPTS